MRSDRVLHAVNSHTEGMPTRVITGGVGTLPGATMLERKTNFERDRDDLRTLLMYEPRGHGAMSGAILQPPTRSDADVGVLFIEVSGCLAMCGHGTIGVCTVLVETGMVEVTEPVTTIHLDTPAGLVRADIEVADGRAEAVTITNVPSFVVGLDLTVEVPGHGQRTFDLAYGGNFYASLPAADLGLELDPAQAPALIATGLEVMAAINSQHRPVHPEQPGIAGCRHVVLTGPAAEGADGRGATVIHPGWIDRSPCGTGTSAHLAVLHARGALELGTPYVNESLIGSRFTGRLVAETRVGDRPAVVPTIRGRAWITGTAQYLLDPSDPFPAGFLIGAASDDALACDPAPTTSPPAHGTTHASPPAVPAPDTSPAVSPSTSPSLPPTA
jgi:proline racemase